MTARKTDYQDKTPLLTKSFTATDDGWVKDDYDDAALYDAETYSASDFADMVELLMFLREQPHSCIVRGEPIDETRNIRRALRDDPKRGPATIRPRPGGLRWIMLDMDKIPVASFGFTTNQERLDHLVSLLPPCFHNATYFYQWSSSASIYGWDILSAHFWFWLSTPWECRNLYLRFHEGDFKDSHVDPAPFTPNQPIYTADPIFTNCEDPISDIRTGIIVKDEMEVTLPPFIRTVPPRDTIPAKEHHRMFPFSRFEQLLGDIGPGYHHEIRKAIAHYCSVTTESEYDRYDLLTRVQTAIDFAPQGKNRKSDYRSSRYLDRLIDGAERKFRWGKI